MKISFLLLSLIVLTAACHKNDPEVSPLVAEDSDWVKLEVPFVAPTDDQAYAIAGDLDNTLLVATRTAVFTTSDQGKTWQLSKDFGGPVPCLLQRQDTIFAFDFSKGEATYGERTAFEVNYFTLNSGKTWQDARTLAHSEHYLDMVQATGRVQTSGITYSLRENGIATSPTERLLVASDLLRTTPSEQTALRLPARHYLNNLHLDAQNRLYVAASGLTFDQHSGTAIRPNENTQAVVYISRKPLP